MTTALGPYVRGEVPPPLVYQFQDIDGVKVPITGFHGVFVLKKTATATAVERAIVLDATESTLTFTWGLTDLDTDGTGSGQFWVGSTDGTRKYASEDYEWDVESGVGDDVPNFGP